MPKQQTIQQAASVSGVGLHTGAVVNMTFKPAPENHGYVFQRIDLKGKPLVAADVDHVVDTSRGTTIAVNGVRVHTVEHTLAALVGLEIDNALIELDGPEPPAMDGSSKDFTKAIAEAGFTEQKAERKLFIIDEPIIYEEADRKVYLSVVPSAQWEMKVKIDFDSANFSPQEAYLKKLETFPKVFADCRTFCFLHEVEPLLQAGLIKGGTLNSAVVIVDRQLSVEETERLGVLFERPGIQITDEGVLNQGGFRYPNEPARHKLLDLLGDLALVGLRIQGQVLAIRPGHKANVELAKKIKRKFEQLRLLD